MNREEVVQEVKRIILDNFEDEGEFGSYGVAEIVARAILDFLDGIQYHSQEAEDYAVDHGISYLGSM